ncbi:MAG: hypothetical protein KR126chlam4_00299 [Candidatus Anoxychlamydiales bacterium]|nr:hypothetical protein [Candidatus Anoxychlamydiales bacterium]HEU64735.1 hypothetical protein [Chlamydiota bacterium]
MKNRYLKVIKETPILNTDNFRSIFGGIDQNSLKTDEKGHIRAIEFVALKDMVFKIEEKTIFPYIYKISSTFYKSENLYIDSRFTIPLSSSVNINPNYILTPNKIIKRLISHLGEKYIWGANYSKGIKNLLKFYPPSNKINKDVLDKWILKGVDCSGILFEATNGFTPRDTKDLLNYKNPVLIENLSIYEISKKVKPLDIIVFKGHIVIILNENYTIESRENFGVIKTPLIERIEEIHQTKKPKNIYQSSQDYVIRRWI